MEAQFWIDSWAAAVQDQFSSPQRSSLSLQAFAAPNIARHHTRLPRCGKTRDLLRDHDVSVRD